MVRTCIESVEVHEDSFHFRTFHDLKPHIHKNFRHLIDRLRNRMLYTQFLYPARFGHIDDFRS